VEERIEQLCLAFETLKPCLAESWSGRRPDVAADETQPNKEV
jgi:hypothetical protein